MRQMRILQGEREGDFTALVQVRHGALLYVESQGQGPAILLVHGWGMSGRFWQRQVKALRNRFQVVTVDLRGHGLSSKTLQGHTMPQYAEDLEGVMEALDLNQVTLVGWSLAGPVVLDYWQTFDRRRLKALALVEMTPCPLADEEWNTHALAGKGPQGMADTVLAWQEDRKGKARQFIPGMFHGGLLRTQELEWMIREHLNTPTPILIAAYSDYLMRDYRPCLERLNLPVLAVYGASGPICFGPKLGEHLAQKVPGLTLKLMAKSGHTPFYEEPEPFNQALVQLAEAPQPESHPGANGGPGFLPI